MWWWKRRSPLVMEEHHIVDVVTTLGIENEEYVIKQALRGKDDELLRLIRLAWLLVQYCSLLDLELEKTLSRMFLVTYLADRIDLGGVRALLSSSEPGKDMYLFLRQNNDLATSDALIESNYFLGSRIKNMKQAKWETVGAAWLDE